MGIPGRQKGKCLCFLVFQVAPAVLLSPPNPQCNAISASIPSAATPGLSARLFINLLVPGRPSGDPVPAGKLLLSSWKMIPGVTIIFPVIVGKHVKMSIGIRRNVAKPPPPDHVFMSPLVARLAVTGSGPEPEPRSAPLPPLLLFCVQDF